MVAWEREEEEVEEKGEARQPGSSSNSSAEEEEEEEESELRTVLFTFQGWIQTLIKGGAQVINAR